jgi:hypothetical protein
VQTDTLSHKNPCKKAHALVKNCRQTKNEKKKNLRKGKQQIGAHTLVLT